MKCLEKIPQFQISRSFIPLYIRFDRRQLADKQRCQYLGFFSTFTDFSSSMEFLWMRTIIYCVASKFTFSVWLVPITFVYCSLIKIFLSHKFIINFLKQCIAYNCYSCCTTLNIMPVLFEVLGTFLNITIIYRAFQYQKSAKILFFKYYSLYISYSYIP